MSEESQEFQIEYIDIDLIEPNSWNPNKQSKKTFEKLKESIVEDGCDDPVKLVPIPNTNRFRIIDGFHRYKVEKELGKKKLASIVRRENSFQEEYKQKVTTMRRNLLRGETDPEKFTKLVDEVLEDKPEINTSEISEDFGFEYYEDFIKYYDDDVSDLKEEYEKEVKKSKKESDEISININNLTDIVDTILSTYGETLKDGFMWFFFGEKMQLYLKMDDELSSKINKLSDYATKNNINVIDFLSEAIEEKLNK